MTDAATMAGSEERYVLFLDLLGFKDLVAKAATDLSERQRLDEIMRCVQETLSAYPTHDLQLTYFSDCLVYSLPRSPQSLAELLLGVEVLTTNLLQLDVLVRGGIAVGWAVHKGSLLYGTAVTEAYELENTGHAPITCLAAAVLDDIRNYGAPPQILMEYGGQTFVNFLRQFAAYRPTPIYSGMVIMDQPAARVMNFISHRLNIHEGRVLAKAEWVQAYWNSVVVPGGVFGPIEKGTTERVQTDGPIMAIRRMVAGGDPGIYAPPPAPPDPKTGDAKS